jgi:hypothetical protein
MVALHLGMNLEIRHFTLGVRTKKIQELSNPIGGEIKIAPKGFALEAKTKACQNDVVPIWCQIFLVMAQQNNPYNSFFGPEEHLNKIQYF